MGIVYSKGHGVQQDYATAAKWYRKTAEQEHARGQYGLAVAIIAQGTGLPQDSIQAHKWLNIAEANGHEKAMKLRSILAKKMTLAQIAEAQKLAGEWIANSKTRKP